jgi:DNA-binding Lrp family transcriptional regulator
MVAQSINELTDNRTGLVEEIQMNIADLDQSKSMSRDDLLIELEGFGIDVEAFDSLPTVIIADILASLRKIMNTPLGRKERSPRGGSGSHEGPPILSETDKKILKTLLTSSGNVSSLTLSKNLDIPLSTVQRRRKRLEASLLEEVYSLRMDKFGLRSAILFLTTSSGSTELIGREILSWDNEVVSVKRCIGENSVDLQVEIVFESNKELLTIMERIKSVDGVTNVSWSEAVKVIGKNTRIYERAIHA